MLTQLTIFLYIVAFLYGIVIGSFLNVLIFRIPKKENIVQSSHCMNCGRKLGWRDMVPVFSYIILRGRCRQCGARINRGFKWCAVCGRFHGGRFHVQQCAVLPHDICPDCHCGHR